MHRGRRSERFLATVLFTDIADSTRFAVERGDRDWRDLLERHHAIVREELRRFGGREIDTAGDGFFATFDAPAAAVACALNILERTAGLGLRLRAGIHTGEVEQVGPKVGGVAVHIAARILGAARTGEVQVSATVRDLVAGAGFEFEDRGEQELRGIPGTWRLFAATGGQQLRASAARSRGATATALARVPRRGGRRRARWVLTLAVIAVVASGVLVAAFALTRPPPGLDRIAENSVGLVDPRTGRLVHAIPVGPRLVAVAVSEDAAWVASGARDTVSRIDPTTRAVVDTIRVGDGPAALAVGFDSVWVTNSGERTVSRINTATNDVVSTIEVGNAPVAVAVGADAVWVANRFDSTVSRIDPGNGRVTQIGLPSAPAAIAATGDGVWVAAPDANTVLRLDRSGTSIVASTPVGNAPQALAATGDGVWVANSGDGTVSRIDRSSNAVVETVKVGPGPGAIAAAGDHVWVACALDDAVYRIDGTGTATRVPVGSSPSGVAATADDLLLTTQATTASHRGGTLRVVSDGTAFDSLDPAVAFAIDSWTLVQVTSDGLVGYAREPGVGGTSIVPNLATSVPQPTDAGRTYTFQLRSGLVYSDGRPVEAAHVRRSIERIFAVATSPEDISPGASFYQGIVGAERCMDPSATCDLSEGIVTDDAAGTVTIRLTEPDPDFLHKLSMPFASIVPDSVPHDALATSPMPATGPYMVASATDTEVRLVRNPRFVPGPGHVRLDGYVDEILWTFGPTPEEQVGLVLAGEADYMVARIPVERLEELRTTRPAQLHPFVHGTGFAWLNTTVPPFDDVRVRRAVNLALDRAVVVEAIGGPARAQPTCQVVPPAFIGYAPYCPWTEKPSDAGTWSGPDLDSARGLVEESGSAGAVVDVVAFGPFVGPAEHVVAVLDDLGFDASLKVYERGQEMVRDALDPEKGREIEAGLVAWFFDYPAASSLFVPNFTCDDPGNLARFCDPSIDGLIERATSLQATDVAAAGRAWSEVDRAVVDAAPWAPLFNFRELDFVGDRVGNYGRHPVWGVMLDQLWVQ